MPSCVMISLHVGSSRGSAEAIKAYLLSLGVPEVWICTEMGGGADFRAAIHNAVDSCDVFLPLMNQQWADSGECYDEYSLARRKNLTSFERGVTSKGQPRKPVFVPIALPGLDWSAPHIEVLASYTNFLVHDQATVAPDAPILKALARSLKSLGFALPKFEDDGAPLSVAPSSAIAASANSVSPAEQLTALIGAAMTLLPQLKSGAGQGGVEEDTAVEIKDTDYSKVLKPRYMGILQQNYGGQMVWALEIEFDKSRMEPGAKNHITFPGAITYSLLNHVEDASMEEHDYWHKWVMEHIANKSNDVETLQCDLDVTAGLIIAKGVSVTQECNLIAADEYRLVLSVQGRTLTGLSKGTTKVPYDSTFRAKAF
eukprot:m.5985 g.5985  ORF g.5985 m.5985 type:complete len:370 (-) comp3887_c0_seq1:44-1153(-)